MRTQLLSGTRLFIRAEGRSVSADLQMAALLLVLKLQERRQSVFRERRIIWLVHHNDSAELLEQLADGDVSLLNPLE